jgi:hypothetical protein
VSFIKNGSSVLQYFIKKIARSGKHGKIFFEDEKIFRIDFLWGFKESSPVSGRNSTGQVDQYNFA